MPTPGTLQDAFLDELRDAYDAGHRGPSHGADGVRTAAGHLTRATRAAVVTEEMS